MALQEKIILNGLIANTDFSKKVIPHIEPIFFEKNSDNIIFQLIYNYFQKYHSTPSKEVLYIELENSKSSENLYKETKTRIDEVVSYKTVHDLNWLMESSEKWAKERKVYLAMLDGVNALEDQSKHNLGTVIDKLREAVGYSFDSSVGHDFFEEANNRYTYYTKKEHKIPFAVNYMNKITDGGLSPKTLNMILAGVHTGKTLSMCSFAADFIRDGRNVLYISMEMSEQEIARRIDANILDISLDEFRTMSQSMYKNKVEQAKSKCLGKLIIKDFPTGAASSIHFDYLLNELSQKKNFKPDVIFIDYLNICASAKIKDTSNSYKHIGSIAMELRGLAIQHNVAIFSATQVNRQNFKKSDVEMDGVSESFAVPMHLDFLLGLVSSEELREQGLIRAKQLKNRYTDLNDCNSFMLAIDYKKQRVMDAETVENKKITGFEDHLEEERDLSDLGVTIRKHRDFSALAN